MMKLVTLCEYNNGIFSVTINKYNFIKYENVENILYKYSKIKILMGTSRHSAKSFQSSFCTNHYLDNHN